MKSNKEFLEMVAEDTLALLICILVWKALVYVGWYPPVEFSIWQLFAAFFASWLIAGYLDDKLQDYLFKRKVMKVAREVAKYQGLNPKKLKYDNIKIIEGDDGMVDVEIEIDKEK